MTNYVKMNINHICMFKKNYLTSYNIIFALPLSDPYVKVSIFYMSKRLKKKKTSTQHTTRSPVFNEALVFNVDTDFLQHLTIEFQVMHENRFGPNEVSRKTNLVNGEKQSNNNNNTMHPSSYHYYLKPNPHVLVSIP